ncbi:Pantothenate kinase 4 [Homalodisca vitripennis]|nr:Pantothenate kinase 4 [Homalodisca vitripennis]
MFDWGAKEVVDLMEAGGFGFKQARDRIPERPWLVDCLDRWLERLEGSPHKCAAIFIDNSGVDFVLGILPFARELLRRGTKVILCANSAPALNDVTHSELLVLIRQVSSMCDVIAGAVTEGRLVAMETAQAGPCLDLRRDLSSLTLSRSHCFQALTVLLTSINSLCRSHSVKIRGASTYIRSVRLIVRDQGGGTRTAGSRWRGVVAQILGEGHCLARRHCHCQSATVITPNYILNANHFTRLWYITTLT